MTHKKKTQCPVRMDRTGEGVASNWFNVIATQMDIVEEGASEDALGLPLLPGVTPNCPSN